MGKLFIENEHDYDAKNHFYCKNCEHLKIEIGTISELSRLECETEFDACYTFFHILHNNVFISKDFKTCEIYPDNEHNFCMLDLNSYVSGGLLREVVCKGCMDVLGWRVAYHSNFRYFVGLFFMKKSKLV